MRYTFDPKKLALNVQQHQVWFRQADAFEWETAQIQADSRQRYTETRFIAAGLIGVRLHVLVFCFHDVSIRIISLRKANNREKKRYARNA